MDFVVATQMSTKYIHRIKFFYIRKLFFLALGKKFIGIKIYEIYMGQIFRQKRTKVEESEATNYNIFY